MEDHKYQPINDSDALPSASSKSLTETVREEINELTRKTRRKNWVDKILLTYTEDWNIVKENGDDRHSPIFDPEYPKDNHTYHLGKAVPLETARFHLAMLIIFWRDIPIPEFI